MSVAVQAPTLRRPVRAVVSDYVALTKPRVILLLEVCALAAMVMAARGWPGTAPVLWTLLGGALSAGGANAINQWFDRDIDSAMHRTCTRPVPGGRIAPAEALLFGISLGAAAFMLLALAVNLLSAVLATGALLFYVLVYTMYLKRSSAQNIVIGGAAGAVPPLVGWAAVTGGLDLAAVYLFAIVFYWTPPHFWALALLLQRDYADARVPMLPVAAGVRHTQRQIMFYTLIMVLVTALPVATRSFGAIYLVSAALLDALFVVLALRVARGGGRRAAAQLFHYSLVYLALLFAMAAVDRVVIGG